jgi:ribosomal protein S18 acetylase RimI-like enzyme
MIRQGRRDEVAALQAIEKHARARYAELSGFEFAATSPPIAAERLSAGKTWVAEVSGEPVGFALVQLLDGALYLANISIVPTASRRGFGARLLEMVIGHAEEYRRRPLRLQLFAYRLGTGLGFVGRDLGPCPMGK